MQQQQQQQLGQRPSSSSSAAECTLYVRSMYRHTDVCERSCQIRAGGFSMFPPALHPCLCDYSVFSFRATGDNNIAMGVRFRLPSRLFAGVTVQSRLTSFLVGWGRVELTLSLPHSSSLTLSTLSIPLAPVSAAIRPLSQSSPASTHPSCSHPVSLNPEDPSPIQFAVLSRQSTLTDDSLEFTGQQPTGGLGN
ncbi:hypothetical protein BJY00DRAFT_192198 [Aspergillus carlsbadensis]|nr:hypothetical protein BJY00DRAFT_192198 [Aspergillus carlsbadensis]